MVNPDFLKFKNFRSVRFNLDNFALPVVKSKQKNMIYTNYLSGLKGTKNCLLPSAPNPNHYGYDHVAVWNGWIFAANNSGLYYAEESVLSFGTISNYVFPHGLCAVNNRLFLIAQNRKRILYSVDLRNEWDPHDFLENLIYIPDNYGLCLDIRHYRNRLLLICENGLLTINRNLVLEHLSDDSEQLKTNLTANNTPLWQSDWFSLNYATDTQTLREVFLKTDVALTLMVTSNRKQRAIHVSPQNNVQKIKTNLLGDQFRIAIIINDDNFCISDLSAVVSFGKRG